MKTTHTSGPWTITSRRNDEDNEIHVLQGRVQAIHATGQPWIPEDIGEIYDPESADARLIASAPELLATLEKVLTVTVKAAEYMSPDANVDALLHEAYALLTKATQSQP